VLNGTRAATRVDLLLTTAMEILADQSLQLGQLHAEVVRAWPGARVSPGELREILESAAARGERLVCATDGLTGLIWRLDDDGRDLVTTSGAWLAAARGRAVAAIRARAATTFRTCTAAEAELWTERLAQALFAGINAAERAYLGDVMPSNNAVLRPSHIDQSILQQAITAETTADVAEFLMACALAALDPNDPFGNELVSMLATVCVLHGHLAQLDVAAQASHLGGLRGLEAVLDTPLLLELVGGTAQREPLERMIDAAVESGVQVVLLEHYLQELIALVAASAEEAARFDARLRTPEEKRAYAALADGENVLVVYAELLVEGTVSSWAEFEKHVARLGARLQARGASVRQHGNNDHDQVESCARKLRDVLAESGLRRPRTAEAVIRDAHTLSMAYRHRRRHRRTDPDATWPSTVVITHDRRLARAYELVDVIPQFPLTLKPEAFTLLLARVRPGTDLQDLTAAAASMLTRQIAERVVMRYPPSIALDMAAQLGDAASVTDVRVAQLSTVYDVLNTATTADDVLIEVARHRNRRHQHAALHADRIGKQVLVEHADALDKAVRDRDQHEARRLEAVERGERALQENEQLRAQLAAAPTDDQVRARTRRATIRGVVVALNTVATLAALVLGGGADFVCFLVATVAIWWQTRQWVEDAGLRLRDVAIGIVSDTAGVVLLVAPAVR
jgi:hypothetical protein